MAEDTEFHISYENKYLLNINPGGDAEYVEFAEGIAKFDWSPNETVTEDAYMDCEGGTYPMVTGAKYTCDVTGHRVVGNAAQDYIMSLVGQFGKKRNTQLRWTKTDGRAVECDIVIANIKPESGDADAKEDFSCKLYVRGKGFRAVQEAEAEPEPSVA